jgi:hypothetical protein
MEQYVTALKVLKLTTFKSIKSTFLADRLTKHMIVL